MRLVALACLAALLPGNAQAHLVGLAFGDFYAGSLHLMLAPEHVAAMLIVGLIGAQQRIETGRWALIALPLGLILGCVAALGIDAVDAVDPLVAASLAVGGLLGIAALRLPAAAMIAVAAGMGILHGYANGVSGRDAPVDMVLYLSGIAAAGAVLGTLGLAGATALMHWQDWVRLGSRVLSSWVATVGVLMIGLTLLR